MAKRVEQLVGETICVEQGTPARDIYLQVFQPAQREVGRLGQTNRISVALEHYVTAATQPIMSQLYPRIFSPEKTGRRLIATCVGGELHEIGVRMVADFFEMDELLEVSTIESGQLEPSRRPTDFVSLPTGLEPRA